MRFVIAAGGTGGHLFPGLAVGEVLLARGHEVMILISEKEIDALATTGRTEFRFEKIPGVGMPRLFSLAIVPFLGRCKRALDSCRRLYHDFAPDAVLGMGGFTSTAPILAARLREVPALVHESNAIPGKANRLNAKMAKVVLLGFAECVRYFPRARCEITGTPVRRSLENAPSREAARAAFGLDATRQTLLVMGGSQGARGINQALVAAFAKISAIDWQLIHLTGKADEESVRASCREAGLRAFVAPFHHRMEEAYAAANLCVARSGAATLTELAHFALPSVLIPYPHAADDHQTANARIFESAGAAVIVAESKAGGGMLAETLTGLCGDRERLKTMSARAAGLAKADAANCVVETMLDLCEHPSR